MVGIWYCCEGCGEHVAAFGIKTPPADGFCTVCRWIAQRGIPVHDPLFCFYRGDPWRAMVWLPPSPILARALPTIL